MKTKTEKLLKALRGLLGREYRLPASSLCIEEVSVDGGDVLFLVEGGVTYQDPELMYARKYIESDPKVGWLDLSFIDEENGDCSMLIAAPKDQWVSVPLVRNPAGEFDPRRTAADMVRAGSRIAAPWEAAVGVLVVRAVDLIEVHSPAAQRYRAEKV